MSTSSPVTSETTAGTGQEHRRAPGHDHEVVQRRAVGGAAGGRPADDRYLRHDARQADVLAEDRAEARERREALLHARSGRLEEPEHGHARAAGQAQHLDDRLRVRLPERAAGERRVLGVAEHLAPVDARVRREHAVAGTRALAHPARAHLGAQQLQRAGVGQHLQPLERRRGARRGARAARGSARHAASRHSTALCPPKPNEFDSASTGAPPSEASSGRARRRGT